QRLALAMSYDDGVRRFRFGCSASGLDLQRCGAIWWRRPQSPEISPRVRRPSHRLFAVNETVEALQGLWHALDTFWINDPARDHVAQRKAHQLRVAQEVGLEIPPTLITSCVGAAREFIAAHGGPDKVIYKSFSATEQEWRETRLLHAEEVGLLENVQYTP